VSDRGLPVTDGAHACPFVAFEDDRDERATVPDRRHRCYAEIRPSPRALAHQEAYCLSSAFPVCPTFQDWARRESARARDARDAAAAAAASSPGAGALAATEPDEEDDRPTEPRDELEPAGAAAAGLGAFAAAGDADEPTNDAEPPAADAYDDDGPRRNPPRDWSAPPPWLASEEAGSRRDPSDPPNFLAHRSEPGRGLAGSAADQLAGGAPPRPSRQSAYLAARPEAGEDDADERDVDVARELPRSPAASSRRPRTYDQHLGGPSEGPDWERPRRYEAYPTIKTRIGMPAVPRLGVLAGALVIAALVFFFLPGLLGFGGGEQATATPSPSAFPSASAAPTPTPEPTPIVYVIKKGDTLSKVASAHGITLEQLLAANKDIKNPNRITEGQEITIPAPEPDVPEDFGGSAEPSAEPS